MSTPLKVHIIGIGDDGLAALTEATRQLLADAEIVIGSDATLRLVPSGRPNAWSCTTTSMRRSRRSLHRRASGS
ncbi:MAG: hypothetical protein AB7U73_02840, partial [Pirellulales bacterium]